MPGYYGYGFYGVFPGAVPPPPPPVAGPHNYFGRYSGRYFGRYFGAISGGVVPAPPIGSGPTIVGAIIDAFENAPALADFEGRIRFGEAFPDTPFPYCELTEANTHQEFDSSDTYIDFIDFQFLVWDEEPHATREFGLMVQGVLDFCVLEFDDGDLIEFRRLNSKLMRPVDNPTRGSTRQFHHLFTYRAMVNRTV